MNSKQLIVLKEIVQESVQETVNGKIDRVYAVLEGQNRYMEESRDMLMRHFERTEPIIKAFEESQAVHEAATKYGERVIFWGKVIAAVLAIFAFIQLGLIKLINFRP